MNAFVKFFIRILGVLALLSTVCTAPSPTWQRDLFLLTFDDGYFFVDLETGNSIDCKQIRGHTVSWGTDLRIYSVYNLALIRYPMSDSVVVLELDSGNERILVVPKLKSFKVVGDDLILCEADESPGCILFHLSGGAILIDTLQVHGLKWAMHTASDDITTFDGHLIFQRMGGAGIVAYNLKTKSEVSIEHISKYFSEDASKLMSLWNTVLSERQESSQSLLRIRHVNKDTVLRFTQRTSLLGPGSAFSSGGGKYVTLKERDRLLEIRIGPLEIWRFATAGFGDYLVVDIENWRVHRSTDLDDYARLDNNPFLVDCESVRQLGFDTPFARR